MKPTSTMTWKIDDQIDLVNAFVRNTEKLLNNKIIPESIFMMIALEILALRFCNFNRKNLLRSLDERLVVTQVVVTAARELIGAIMQQNALQLKMQYTFVLMT